MPADGPKVLTAILVAVFEDVDSGMPLAPDTKSFDVRIPDGLVGCQLGYGFERNATDGQLATESVKLIWNLDVLITR